MREVKVARPRNAYDRVYEVLGIVLTNAWGIAYVATGASLAKIAFTMFAVLTVAFMFWPDRRKKGSP